ncbi:MAG: glycosyltransferase family 4 protein [candidate division WOR-3 bacterium]
MEKKILIVFRHHSTFIENDCKILRNYFSVDIHKINFSPKNFLKLFNKIKTSDAIIGWFASWGTALALIVSKILNKKFLIIAGGLDAAWIKIGKKIKNTEISGLFEIIEKIIAKFVFSYSDVVLPVSNFTKQGVLLISKPKRIEVVYNGLPCIKNKIKKEKLVITVATLNKFNVKKKGLTTFAKASRLLPHIKFFIVGKYSKNSFEYKLLKRLGGKNLHFTGYLPKKELFKIMRKAKVYCQLSYSESFGYALAEAMLCKCVPVVTKRTALPEVVGDSGFYVDYGDVKKTVKTIIKALKTKKLGNKARERVLKYFSLRERGKKISNLINNMLIN